MFPSYKCVSKIICGVEGCQHECSVKQMINHKAFKHDIDVQWQFCDQCDLKFKNKSTLTSHKIYKHDPPRPVLTCTKKEGCKFHTKSKINYDEHVRNCGRRIEIIHEITNIYGERSPKVTVIYL
jgi:hypothetical protein